MASIVRKKEIIEKQEEKQDKIIKEMSKKEKIYHENQK